MNETKLFVPIADFFLEPAEIRFETNGFGHNGEHLVCFDFDSTKRKPSILSIDVASIYIGDFFQSNLVHPKL